MKAAIERPVVRAIAGRFLIVMGLLAGSFLHLPAAAQASYPSKPITFVVPFPPGGSSDLAARPLANALGRILKQPIVVFNRPGAGGAIGTGAVANAEPDGYTVLVGLSSMATTPEADRIYERKPMYEMKQLLPVARVTADPLLVVVREDSPYRSLKDLVDDARKRPGKISFASSGNYGPNHVGMEMLAHAAGVKVLSVAYAGGAATTTALLGGQVDFTMMAPSVAAANRKSGKVRALGVLAASRLPTAPEIPTAKELGYDVEYSIWSGVFVPAATPEPVVHLLRDAIRKAVQDRQFVDTMNTAEMPPAYMDAPEFRAFVEADSARLVTAVRRIGKLD